MIQILFHFVHSNSRAVLTESFFSVTLYTMVLMHEKYDLILYFTLSKWQRFCSTWCGNSMILFKRKGWEEYLVCIGWNIWRGLPIEISQESSCKQSKYIKRSKGRALYTKLYGTALLMECTSSVSFGSQRFKLSANRVFFPGCSLFTVHLREKYELILKQEEDLICIGGNVRERSSNWRKVVVTVKIQQTFKR